MQSFSIKFGSEDDEVVQRLKGQFCGIFQNTDSGFWCSLYYMPQDSSAFGIFSDSVYVRGRDSQELLG